MNKAIIIIPIYKNSPDEFETISFLQCLKVLHRYKICVVTYDSLDVSYYKNELQNAGVDFAFEFFDNEYFNDIAGYNRLMLSLDFYNRFSQYEYMLIYQLDAYVFRDELEDWCMKGYDYIGAPWFEGWDSANQFSGFTGVGNGGFSLRKISTALSVWSFSNFYKNRKSNKELYNEFKVRNRGLSFYKKGGSLKYFIFQILGMNNNFFWYINNFNQNEDVFWTIKMSEYLKKYKVAEVKDAIAFSFEVNPSLLYKMNDNKLPFGCHAWQKYEFNKFWKNFINYNVE